MKTLCDSELATVMGGEMKPSASGVVQSEKNANGKGITVDWNGPNQQRQQRSPTDGVFPFRGGDGSNGNGGWALV